MKFLADECCSASLVQNLRDEGHDVVYIMELHPSATDKEVLEKAYLEKRILITEDKDFGELVLRLKKKTHGVILLRFTIADQHLKWPKLKKLIELKPQTLSKKFVVIDKEKFRIQKI